VLIPKHQGGTITYSKNRWRQSGGGFVQNYLKIFAQEGIGRPDLEIDSDIDSLTKFLKKRLPEGIEVPDIKAALVFSHPEIKIQADEAPSATIPARKLKEMIRKEAKGKPISPDIVAMVQNAITPEEAEEND